MCVCEGGFGRSQCQKQWGDGLLPTLFHQVLDKVWHTNDKQRYLCYQLSFLYNLRHVNDYVGQVWRNPPQCPLPSLNLCHHLLISKQFVRSRWHVGVGLGYTRNNDNKSNLCWKFRKYLNFVFWISSWLLSLTSYLKFSLDLTNNKR